MDNLHQETFAFIKNSQKKHPNIFENQHKNYKYHHSHQKVAEQIL